MPHAFSDAPSQTMWNRLCFETSFRRLRWNRQININSKVMQTPA